jgi:hypothetical protein
LCLVWVGGDLPSSTSSYNYHGSKGMWRSLVLIA